MMTASLKGRLGNDVSIFLERLCELLRLDFYADKPVECSSSSFTVNKTLLTVEARNILDWAELTRVIIPAGYFRQAKNSQQLHNKYHLNGLLCPRWGLPIGHRGSLNLNKETAEIILNVNDKVNFDKFKAFFEGSRYAPYPVLEESHEVHDVQLNLDF